jgi:hypothetical protein
MGNDNKNDSNMTRPKSEHVVIQLMSMFMQQDNIDDDHLNAERTS